MPTPTRSRKNNETMSRLLSIEPTEVEVPPLPALPKPSTTAVAAGEEQNSPKKMKAEETKTEELDIKADANSTSNASRNNTSTHRRRNSPQHQWNEKFAALKEYKQIHGHVNVPKKETFHQLGRFVNNQRQFYRKRMIDGEKNSLSDERIHALEELGFVWSMKPISVDRATSLQTLWEQRIHELKEYKKIHSHCNVSIKGNDKELGKFVMNQRYYYKTRLEGQKNSLTAKRIKDLEDIGFVWTLKGVRKESDGKFLNNEQKWERNIEELKKFKLKFGHVNVTKSKEHNDLGQFVGNQRFFYRRLLKGEGNSLTDERITILTDLGFDWRARNRGGTRYDTSLKTKDNIVELEKDKAITFQDESTADYATRESSQKRLVLLEDGSQALETTTKRYTTMIEKIMIPAEEVEGTVELPDTKAPTLPDALNVAQSENQVTLPDGTTIVCTTEVSTKKRLIALEDGTQCLEMKTTACTTKVEHSHIPGEEQEVAIESQAINDQLVAEQV